MTDVKDCTDRIAALEVRNEELEAALRCVSVPADVKAMNEKIAALEARVEVLMCAITLSIEELGWGEFDQARRRLQSTLSPVHPVTEGDLA
jgi:hypothetical protein